MEIHIEVVNKDGEVLVESTSQTFASARNELYNIENYINKKQVQADIRSKEF